jgi:trehalose-phosphatase
MNRLLDLVPSGVPVALFLDYDGTLVPIRRRPDLARLSLERRAELGRLGQKGFVSIVSGRPLDELRRLVGVPGLAYMGNHGLELRANGRTWVHPDAARKARAVKRAAAAIRIKARGVRGAIVEDKGLTASVHFRLVAVRHHARLWAFVADEVRRSRDRLVLSQGKKVFEIRPNVPWDKGQGVLEMMRRMCPCYPIYIGDDRTDEDAFRSLRDLGLTIRVGSGRRTLARHRLPCVDDVWELLIALRPRLMLAPALNRPLTK